MGIKIIHEQGKYMDCTLAHGKWCDIDMIGQDVGYAQVGIISSGREHILFQFRDKRGVAPKMFITKVVEVRMNGFRMRKQQELVAEEWDDSVHPYEQFIGKRCDIHVHQTRMFEATPGFFAAKILYVGENIVRFQENSKEYTINQNMICGIMEV